MITLDKVQILCPTDECLISEGKLKPTKIKNGVPIRLGNIESVEDTTVDFGIKYGKNGKELKIAFTSKILGNKYPELINIDTIEECLINVLQLNICEFDVNAVLSNGYSNCLHLTEDVRLSINREQRREIYLLTKNPNIWTIADDENSFAWKKKNKSYNTLKETLKIYDKGIEMKNLQRNRQFMEKHRIPLNTFEGVTRFEHKLENRFSVLNRLNIADNKLSTILSVKQNPFNSTFGNIFNLEASIPYLKTAQISELSDLALLEKHSKDWPICDWNFIKQLLKTINPKNTSRYMKKFNETYNKYINTGEVNSKALLLLNQVTQLIQDRWDKNDHLMQAA